jgi:hypothetical protein
MKINALRIGKLRLQLQCDAPDAAGRDRATLGLEEDLRRRSECDGM